MNVNTLVKDIHNVLGQEGLLVAPSFSDNLVKHYLRQVGKQEEKIRPAKTLYFSELGDVCKRRLWYKTHTPSIGETITPVTRIKFLYGDMLEELVLQLARNAGHSVEGEQQAVEYKDDTSGYSIRGRIDAIVDGAVVDVKSVTKYSEQKFGDGLKDDPFGYYAQLNGYATVLRNKEMGFLTIQKELGHIKYWSYGQSDEAFLDSFNRAVDAVSNQSDERVAPKPASATSKNMKLDVACSYCSFKKECWKDCNDGVGLRAFAYSNKVEFLTKVVDVPRVAEIDLNQAEVDDA